MDSPRFISTLERALRLAFQQVTNGSEEVEYMQFFNAFKALAYDLNDNDVRTLLALAKENENGKIYWEEFIPNGIEAIKTFLARNKSLSK